MFAILKLFWFEIVPIHVWDLGLKDGYKGSLEWYIFINGDFGFVCDIDGFWLLVNARIGHIF